MARFRLRGLHRSRGVGGLESGETVERRRGRRGRLRLERRDDGASARAAFSASAARAARRDGLSPATRLRLKEAEREVPLHPGGGVTPALREDEAASSRVRARGGRASPRDCPRARRPVGRRRRPRRPRAPSVIQQPREGGEPGSSEGRARAVSRDERARRLHSRRRASSRERRRNSRGSRLNRTQPGRASCSS